MIRERLLTPNQWSRSQRPLEQVRGVALHWVENAGTSAEFNWRFFEDRKNGRTGFGSAHRIADKHGILVCIPDDEIAYHAGAEHYTEEALQRWGPYPNSFLLSLELCHPDWSGRFEPETLFHARIQCAYWCWRYDLNPMSDITTHHAVTGKECPRWFVRHPEELDRFRDAVKAVVIGAAA